jgi:phosphate transport system substrate-binding protein
LIIMRVNTRFVVAAASTALLLSTMVGPASAAALRVSGAAAVAGGIMTPNKAAIEQETGLTLAVAVNGDANGLKDLYAGRSDVAMVAAPMKLTEAAVNKVTPDSLSIADFQLAPVGTVTIHFVVNATNPVKSLTAAQLRDIFTGKITSWQQVGGSDAPILVVAEVPGLGTRSNIVASFLDGAEISATARTMQALVQVVQVVGQLPNAIGYGNAASITGNVAMIPDVTVKQPIGLATKGAPGPDALKLIAVVTKYGAAVK